MNRAQVLARPGAVAFPATAPPSGRSRGASGSFAGKHVLTMAQYDRSDLEYFFEVADDACAARAVRTPERPLAGRLLMSAFFERSTRTRLAHEAAMIRLGGNVSGFAEPWMTRAGGSTQESSDDIARMLSLYGDVVVVRHPTTGWPRRAAGLSRGALFINGGDGVGEHPTQALVDLYTLRQRFGSLDGLRVLLVNDLRMRCVNSLLLGLRHFGCEVYGVAATGKQATADSVAGAYPMTLGQDLSELLPKVDVVYSSPTVAAEPDDGGTATGPRPVTLHRSLLTASGNEDLIVLHPLPRKSELATDLDDTRFNGYAAQAANGVPVRMALLKLMFDAQSPTPSTIASGR